jgi:sarcosine oxidase subunit gamma
MSDPRFESPLARLAAPQGLSIGMREIADRGMIDMRGDAANPRFQSAVNSVLGLQLPLQPRTSVASGATSILWLSVDQWLVLCPRAAAPDLTRKLKEPFAGLHSLVVDVSDARAIIRLEGEGVREVLMKGAPVDLLSPVYGTGTVRRVSFAEIGALIHVVSDAPDVIDLYVFRSFALFAWQWLLATAREGAKVRLFAQQPPPVAPA